MAVSTDVDEERFALVVADLSAGVAVERALAATGRCLCGRRPSVRDRLRDILCRVGR